jgi:hypothetical protein
LADFIRLEIKHEHVKLSFVEILRKKFCPEKKKIALFMPKISFLLPK